MCTDDFENWAQSRIWSKIVSILTTRVPRKDVPVRFGNRVEKAMVRGCLGPRVSKPPVRVPLKAVVPMLEDEEEGQQPGRRKK